MAERPVTVITAAERLREQFAAAKKGNHYNNGWYVYMDKVDIETLVAYVLGPPDPEPDSEPTYTTGAGQVLHSLHDPAKCEGEHCVIHNPSHHYMADYPTHWREDRGIMERICPHGVGHPDPDTLDFIRRTRGAAFALTEAVHGCDGCCKPKAVQV